MSELNVHDGAYAVTLPMGDGEPGPIPRRLHTAFQRRVAGMRDGG